MERQELGVCVGVSVVDVQKGTVIGSVSVLCLARAEG